MSAPDSNLPPPPTSPQWRFEPGYALSGGPRPQMVDAFLAQFLNDRTSDGCYPPRDAPWPLWGEAAPYERVVRHLDELTHCGAHLELLSNLLTIVEPWEHVGFNPVGEQVHASRNVAHIGVTAADLDVLLLPLWQTGVGDPRALARLIGQSRAVVLEGGAPSVFAPETFAGSAASRDELFAFYEALLLSRGSRSAPCIFICVSHQLACECLVRLVRRATRDVLGASATQLGGTRAMEALTAASQRITQMGDAIRVVARDGRVIAQHWQDAQFVNTTNISVEVGATALLPYRSPRNSNTTVPGEVLDQHSVLAERGRGILDAMLAFESNITTDMFHGNIVNEEAMLFANWALGALRAAVLPHRDEIAASHLAWLLQLPTGVEIVASTWKDGALETACSSTCIYYTDLESGHVRRSWTCQFHPELQSDLRDFGRRAPPSYGELKKDDGARLLLRLLRAGLSDG